MPKPYLTEEDYRLRSSAHARIAKEVRDGRMPRARTLGCVDCGGPAIQYEHYKGYAPEHWFTVEPVCRACHVGRTWAAHQARKQEWQAKGLPEPQQGRLPR